MTAALQTKEVPASTTTTTELGEFSAIAAAYTVDRQGERIIPGAFKSTILRWRESGKDLPLAWDHSRDARDLIGSIDPFSLRETNQGLYVEGKLDLEDSDQAREAWRSVKANRVGLSFGYLVESEGTGADGVKELHSLDIYEVTLTSTPANADARVLSHKSLDPVRVRRFEV